MFLHSCCYKIWRTFFFFSPFPHFCSWERSPAKTHAFAIQGAQLFLRMFELRTANWAGVPVLHNPFSRVSKFPFSSLSERWKNVQYLILVNFGETTYLCSRVQQTWKECLETWVLVLTPCLFSDMYSSLLSPQLELFHKILVKCTSAFLCQVFSPDPLCIPSGLFGTFTSVSISSQSPDLNDVIWKSSRNCLRCSFSSFIFNICSRLLLWQFPLTHPCAPQIMAFAWNWSLR